MVKPKLVRLLDGVDHVAAAIGEGHDLRAGRLRLQQIGAEIGRVQRMTHAAEHLAAGGLHRGGRIGFERMAEGIVDRDEEPGIAPLGDGRLAPRLVVSA